MIDIEKFICSLLADHPEGVTVRNDIHRALKDQGLEYKDGKIVPIEDKESEDDRVRKFIIKIFKDSQRDGISEVIMPEQYDKIFAWLEKQKGNDKEIPNSAWSEEDEERLDSIIESYKDLLRDYKACHDADYIPYNSDTLIRNVVDDVNFLKSLIDRYTWKPSDEQMEAMQVFLEHGCAAPDREASLAEKVFESLYNDLKNL